MRRRREALVALDGNAAVTAVLVDVSGLTSGGAVAVIDGAAAAAPGAASDFRIIGRTDGTTDGTLESADVAARDEGAAAEIGVARGSGGGLAAPLSDFAPVWSSAVRAEAAIARRLPWGHPMRTPLVRPPALSYLFQRPRSANSISRGLS